MNKQSNSITWVLVGIQVLLIALKLDGQITWDWIAVFSVFPIVIALIVLAALGTIFIHSLKLKG